jgi:hypothetical protein
MGFLLWGMKWLFTLNLQGEAHGFNKWQLGLFTTKIISIVENISLPRLIRPLVGAPDALDTLGGCAAAPTR